MDFSEKDKLYDQAKKSLKKYCTDGNFASASTSAETVKLEHGVNSSKRCLLWVVELAFMIMQANETVGHLAIVSGQVTDQLSLVQPGGFSTFKFWAGPIIPSLGTYEIPIRISKLKETAYLSLVRSTLEYAATIWDPYYVRDIDSLEQVQRRAARFTTGDYHTTSSVTAMLAELGWKRLEDRRKDLRLALLYKIVHGHVAVPVDALNLEPPDPRTRKKHKYTYKHLTPHTDPYKHFFLCRTIPEWNSLPARAVEATSVESFKTHLAGRPQRDQPWSGTPTHPRHTPEEDCGLLYQTRPEWLGYGYSCGQMWLIVIFHYCFRRRLWRTLVWSSIWTMTQLWYSASQSHSTQLHLAIIVFPFIVNTLLRMLLKFSLSSRYQQQNRSRHSWNCIVNLDIQHSISWYHC